MYTQDDLRRAQSLVVRYALILGAVLAVLLAAYIAAVLMDSQGAMLLILLSAFWFAALEIALWLRPMVQYRGFLREMMCGLRRECPCTLDDLEERIQLQDGVRVHALQVRLEDGDTRIFYVNASKRQLLPPMQTRLILISYGRHLVDWRAGE